MKFYSAHHFNWILLIFLIGIGCTAAGELTDELPEEPRDEILIETDEDRKSTRLNSSHVATSYAVLRLKKERNLALTASARHRQLANHTTNLCKMPVWCTHPGYPACTRASLQPHACSTAARTSSATSER